MPRGPMQGAAIEKRMHADTKQHPHKHSSPCAWVACNWDFACESAHACFVDELTQTRSLRMLLRGMKPETPAWTLLRMSGGITGAKKEWG